MGSEVVYKPSCFKPEIIIKFFSSENLMTKSIIILNMVLLTKIILSAVLYGTIWNWWHTHFDKCRYQISLDRRKSKESTWRLNSMCPTISHHQPPSSTETRVRTDCKQSSVINTGRVSTCVKNSKTHGTWVKWPRVITLNWRTNKFFTLIFKSGGVLHQTQVGHLHLRFWAVSAFLLRIF